LSEHVEVMPMFEKRVDRTDDEANEKESGCPAERDAHAMPPVFGISVYQNRERREVKNYAALPRQRTSPHASMMAQRRSFLFCALEIFKAATGDL